MAGKMRKAGEVAEKAPTSTGFGDSKMFIAPEGAFERDLDWEKLTLGGHPIPEHQRGLIPYDLTDQGRIEREQTIEANGGRAVSEFPLRAVDLPGGVGVAGNIKASQRLYVDQTAAGNKIAEQVDLAKGGAMPWEYQGNDAMSEVMHAHLKPGERGRYLSPQQIKKYGLRGWEPVKGENSEPVRVDQMILAKMPADVAVKREQYFARVAREQMVLSQDQVKSQAEQIASERQTKRMTRRDRDEHDDGYESVRGSEAEMNDGDFTAV